MHLFHPLYLLLLPPVAGIIVALYILKLRRRDVVVSSTMLWRQVIRDVQANAPLQKLRRNLLLLLQLIAVLLLVACLARPFARGSAVGGRSIVVVVDTSASMEVVEGRETRLDAAIREANAMIGSMHPGDQMVIVSAGIRPEAVAGFTSDRATLYRSVSGLKCGDTGVRMRDALSLAAALVASREASQIDIVSDGGFAPVSGVDFGHSRVRFHQVGHTAGNVGITAVDYRRTPIGERKVQAFVSVRNFDKAARTFTVEIRAGGNLVDAHELTLNAGHDSVDVFDLDEPSVETVLDVTIDAPDDLAVDNHASLLVPPRRSIRTLLVTAGNPFLETALKVDPNIELSKMAPANTIPSGGLDAVILDGQAPVGLGDGNFLFVDCNGDRCPATVSGTSENAGVLDPDRNHPAMRYVDFGNTRWTSLHYGKPCHWAREIASAENGAAVVAGEQGRFRSMWTGFRLDVSHGAFPVTVGYPIFVAAAVRWLARMDDAGNSQVRTGSPVVLDAFGDTGRVAVDKPDGSVVRLPIGADGSAVYDEADRCGIYTVTTSGGHRRRFAANLCDETESDIAPRSMPDVPPATAESLGRRVSTTNELWPWCATALLLLLAVEWWAFHRRIYLA